MGKTAMGRNGRIRTSQPGAGGSGRKTLWQSKGKRKIVVSTIQSISTVTAENKRGRNCILVARALNKEYDQLRDLAVVHCNGEITMEDFLARSGGLSPEDVMARLADINVQITRLMDRAMIHRIKINSESAVSNKRVRTRVGTKKPRIKFESDKKKLTDDMGIGDEDNAGRT